MATRDSGGQKHATRQNEEVDEVEAATEAAERNEELSESADDILDEIDEALETNSEDFVRQFVQKGGQ